MRSFSFWCSLLLVFGLMGFSRAVSQRCDAEQTSGTNNTGTNNKGAEQPFRIVGYLPDYRIEELNNESVKWLTDLVLFSAEVNASGELDLARLQNLPWSRLQSLKKLHRVRLVLCIGGWERSHGFSVLAMRPEKRKDFVGKVIETCLLRQLDGVDLDWEHPENAQEQLAYGQLLSELKQGFEPHGLGLSMTMASWQSVPQQAFESVDTIQIMAYDHPWKHSTFENATADVDKLLSAGAPANKLTLGIPFYGRSVQTPNQVATYRQLTEERGVAPSVDELDGIYFNGPDTVRKKVQWAKRMGLAGVMVWELGQDARGDKSLLRILSNEAR